MGLFLSLGNLFLVLVKRLVPSLGGLSLLGVSLSGSCKATRSLPRVSIPPQGTRVSLLRVSPGPLSLLGACLSWEFLSWGSLSGGTFSPVGASISWGALSLGGLPFLGTSSCCGPLSVGGLSHFEGLSLLGVSLFWGWPPISGRGNKETESGSCFRFRRLCFRRVSGGKTFWTGL